MEPKFHIRRSGRSYCYYISRPIAGTDDEDAIRRVPAVAAEAFVRRQLARLLVLDEEKLDRGLVRAVLWRVELHASAVHIVLRAGVGVDGSRRVSFEDLRQALQPGEELRKDPGDVRRIRISIPVRLKVRGGRNWIAGPAGARAEIPTVPDVVMIRRLRSAHAVLKACGAEPDASDTQLNYAKAPREGWRVKEAQWAFLAPDIQQAILEGRCSAVKLRGPIREFPLSWAKQRELFDIS